MRMLINGHAIPIKEGHILPHVTKEARRRLNELGNKDAEYLYELNTKSPEITEIRSRFTSVYHDDSNLWSLERLHKAIKALEKINLLSGDSVVFPITKEDWDKESDE